MLNRENEARLRMVKFNYGVVGLSLEFDRYAMSW